MKAGLLAINTHHRGVFYAVGPNGGIISYPECATSSNNGNWISSNTLYASSRTFRTSASNDIIHGQSRKRALQKRHS